MKVYRASMSTPPFYDLDRGDEECIGYYATREVAINAAEIDAEERFEVDDVAFDFGRSIRVAGTTYYEQDYPQGSSYLDPHDPRGHGGPVRAKYTIEEIEVKEEAQ